jgi:ABC-2 type transport system ATP-binding protein
VSNGDIMVSCKGLSKIYSEITALDSLDLEIPRGHVFGYIGHNGAGKTTTIRILAGLLTSSKGQAVIGGVDVSSGRDKIKSLVGYMPDSFGVYDQMRVWEYLDFFGAAYKIPVKKRTARIDYVLDLTDAEYMRDRFVDTLSHGMKQRIGVARTLMHDPQVLLLDEPANGLDPQARVQMRQLIRRLADSGKTVMVSSHILPELAVVCDEVGIIHKGQLKAAGPIQQVLNQIKRDRLLEVKAVNGTFALSTFLSASKQCHDVHAEDAAGGVVRCQFKGDDQAMVALLQSLQQAGIPVVSFQEIPLSLEEAYLKISGISDAQLTEEEEKRRTAQARAELAKQQSKSAKPGAASK